VCGSLARCVECAQGGLPVGFKRNADALQWLDAYLPAAVVFAMHACEPSGKSLRGKGVAGGHYLCLTWLGATQ
jgi:hypothetical protein